MKLISAIVSTFNKPQALRHVLEGYRRCSYRDFEVVVADDGSEEETRLLVEAFARDAPFRLRHAWHRHDGYRLAAARNRASRIACGEILFFTDGDCVPFPGALEIHARRCAPGRAQAGSRCPLTSEETERLIGGQVTVCELMGSARRRTTPRLLWSRWVGRLRARLLRKRWPKFQTANASVHRSDFERVNGFDERFVGWGYEDEDLARRLRRAGVRIQDGTLESRVLHLFHAVHESHRPSARTSKNYRYFKSRSFLTRPIRGLRERTLQDISLQLVGEVPPGLRGYARGPGPAEVTVVFGRESLPLQCPRGEVTLQVPPDAEVASPQGLYQLLQDSL